MVSLMSSAIELSYVREGGRSCNERGILGLEGIETGEIITTSEAYAAVPETMFAEVLCCRCFAVCQENVFACEGCENIQRYCGLTCRSSDLVHVNGECESLPRLRKLNLPGHTNVIARLIIRIVSRRRMEKLSRLEEVAAPHVTDMASCCLSPGACSRYDSDCALSFSNIESLVRHQDEVGEVVLSSINALATTLQSCCPWIEDQDESRKRGLALFPFGSMLNHSCDPNTRHSFDLSDDRDDGRARKRRPKEDCALNRFPPRLVFRAIRPISSGEECCYSYVQRYQTREHRRVQLKETYYFDCECPRFVAATCTTINNDGMDSFFFLCSLPNFKDDLMSGVACPTPGCSGVMNDVENTESSTICCSSCSSHMKRPDVERKREAEEKIVVELTQNVTANPEDDKARKPSEIPTDLYWITVAHCSWKGSLYTHLEMSQLSPHHALMFSAKLMAAYLEGTPIHLKAKYIETCLGDEPSPTLLDLYKKKAKLVEGYEKIESISKAISLTNALWR